MKRLTGASGALALIALVGVSIALVVVVAERPSFLSPPSHGNFFPRWMAGPLSGLVPHLTRNPRTLAYLVTGAITAMYLCYLVALVAAPKLPAHWIVAAVLAVHLVFLLSPPLPYTDVFNYLNYGRMGVVHHLNPYTAIPALEPHSDPSFHISNWHHLRSPYGPLFTLFMYALVPLGVPASFWTLKLVIGLASLGTVAIVWRCAIRLGRDPLPAVLFVGLNPAALVWGLGADHNDSLMMFFVALAVYSVVRARQLPVGDPPPSDDPATDRPPARPARRTTAGDRLALDAWPRGAGSALIAAVAIKASAGILAPILLAATRRRLSMLTGMLFATVALGTISYVAFGAHLPDLTIQSSLVTDVGPPNLFGNLLGLGGETNALRVALTAAAIVAVGICTIWAYRNPDDWLLAAGAALLILVLALSWTTPWYVLWILPFAALARSAYLRTAVIIFGVYLIVVFAPTATDLMNSVNFHPNRTPLGRLHAREISRLVH